MLKCENDEQTFSRNLNEQNDEVEKLRETVRLLSIVNTDNISPTQLPKQRTASNLPTNVMELPSNIIQAAPIECNIQGCTERKRKLIDENNFLLEKVKKF